MRGALTRRRFIGGAAAGAGGVALGAPASGSAARRRRRAVRRVDVAVVGGGLSGLIAATDVARAGRSVVVLEARDRVGGRILNHGVGGGEVVEVGGTWVGPTQGRIAARLRDLRLGTFPQRVEGNHLYLFDGSRMTFTEDGPTGSAPPDPLVLPETASTVTLLNTMSESVPVDAPWTAPDAGDHDSQTLETWLRAHTATPRFRKLARLAVRLILGSETRELSLLFALFYIAAAGDEQTPGTFERLFNTRGGANQDRILGGSQLLPLGLAEQLGRRVLLGRPVRRLAQSRGSVLVEADGATVRARRVIVAIPPALAGRIRYEPLLPAPRDQLTQRMPQGTLTKVEAVYDRPFWRDEGYSGYAVTDAGPVESVYDVSPPDGSPGILVGFVGGDRAREWGVRPDAELHAAALDTFAALYGGRARSPREVFSMHWAGEEWSRGCPVGIMPPGVLSSHGRVLREPIGRLHWAGTETSTYWNGYMEGAVRAGERAAAEVLAEL